LILIVTLTSKAFADSRSHAERKPLRIASAHHQTVFKPPFMTASALLLDFMTVERSTRWLPELETFGSKSGRVRGFRTATGQQPQSFGRRPIVCLPFRRVESN
jgi:hypothetical protein